MLCQFSCHFRHFSAFYRGFCAPPTTKLAPFWPNFGSYFPKNNFFQIFPIITDYIHMLLGQRAAVQAKKVRVKELVFELCPKTCLGLKFARNSKKCTFSSLSSSQRTWKAFNCVFGLADRQTFKLTPVCTYVRMYVRTCVTRYLSIRSLVFSDTSQLVRALAM